MTKYKNISNMRIMISNGSKVIRIKPQEVVDLSFIPYDCLKFLQEVIERKDVKEEPAKIKATKAKKS